MTKSMYELQAEKFLADTSTEMKTRFLGHFPYFPDDKEARDVYEITLTRAGKKPYVFRFGQSLVKSNTLSRKQEIERLFDQGKIDRFEMNRRLSGLQVAPTAYNVLACITKYDPGIFEDFCDEFGYDYDSVQDREVYFAVQKEWSNVQRLFGDVLEQLRRID